MSEIKLGDKVKCKGYLKKVDNLEYIYANKKHFSKENLKAQNTLIEPSHYLEEEGEINQFTRTFIAKSFEGIVTAKKEVSIENNYSQAFRDIYDSVTFGYVDSIYIDEVVVRKENYITCYQVFYAMGKSRLVPISQIGKVECVEDD